MAEKTEISWCDATFNPWWGCAKVSPACDHCYAERDSKRFAKGQVLWGVDAARREFGPKHWDQPKQWNDRADREGRRTRVFCASMADVFDKNAPEGARDRLWQLIVDTPHLDWLLLTKRIGNVARMVPPSWQIDGWPANVWLGATVINQEEADRDVPKLMALPARVRFLSIEPMLGPVDISRFVWPVHARWPAKFNSPEEAIAAGETVTYHRQGLISARWADSLVHWVIAGGESGPQARPAHPEWFRSLRDQCATAGVAWHFKQWGEWGPARDADVIARGEGIGGRLMPSGTLAITPNTLQRVGKRAAGWLLDGIEHKAFPRSAA